MHYKAECLKLSSSSFVADVVEEKSNGSKLVLIVSVSDSRFNNTWVLYILYICELKRIGSLSSSRSIMVMRNGVTCKINVDIGRIRIKMHDGIIRTLTDVFNMYFIRRKFLFIWALNLTCVSEENYFHEHFLKI
jgi:hypothetical protein